MSDQVFLLLFSCLFVFLFVFFFFFFFLFFFQFCAILHPEIKKNDKIFFFFSEMTKTNVGRSVNQEIKKYCLIYIIFKLL